MRLTFLLPLLLTSAALAQSPQLLVAEPGGKQHPVTLSKADVHVLISGYLAQTTMTLTFANDADRVLEGELVFPLPENASVCAYALDVGGQLVDAVSVPKDKARIVYEEEVRRGIDPGIVEKVQGNNFRTRVYPIPAKGMRTVRVQYVSDLNGAGGSAAPVYSLPLKWSQPVAEASLKIEVVKSTVQPQVKGEGLENLAFARWEDRFVAEQKFQLKRFATDLTVSLPGFPTQSVRVERRVHSKVSAENLDPKAAAQFERTDYHFLINDQPPVPVDVLSAKPARIAIAWDASLSRADADHAKELALIERHVKRLGDVVVDVVPFRNVPDAPRTFRVNGGDGSAVIKHLASLVYDGGTSLASVEFTKNPAAEQDKSLPPVAYYLLFTDGLTNLGPEVPARVEVPVFAVSNDPRANHNLLRHLSSVSGGVYTNLQRTPVDQALAALTSSPYALLSIQSDPSEIADVYPRLPQPVQGRVAVAGRLLAKTAKITLNYGIGDQVIHRQPLTISRDDAIDATLASRFWAQLKLADLSLAEDRNEAEITALGKDFNLVTAFTSMIVLETVDQYLRHKIVPPKSRGEVYAQFMEKIEGQREVVRKAEESKINRVLTMWNARLAWWNQEFKYAADFKYVEPKPEKPSAAGGRSDTTLGRGAEAGLALGVPAIRSDPAVTTANPAPAPAAAASTPQLAPAEAAQDHLPTGRVNDPQQAEHLSRELHTGVDGTRSRFGHYYTESGGTNRGFLDPGDPIGRRPANQPPADERGRTSTMGRQTNIAAVPVPDVAVSVWNPDTEYPKALRAAPTDQTYAVYLQQRKTHGTTPAFFLDCADFFAKASQPDLATRILSNIPELALDDGRLLRIAAHRFGQIGRLDLAINLFEKVTRLRPEEPQSFRDLALALADRADKSGRANDSDRARSDYQRSLELLHKVVMNEWARFEEIEVIALMEANQILAKSQIANPKLQITNPFDPRLVKLLDPDLRIVLTWDTDNTDIDLHVVEPSGETAFYAHNRTTIGGLVSRDFTQGYGPEEYVLRRLMPGRYQIRANFYGSRDQKLTGPTTVQATIITNYAKPNEKRESMTLRLAGAKQMIDVGTVTLKP